MLFNSYNFLFLFLPVVLIVLAWLTRTHRLRAGIAWLGFASLVFYGTDHPQFLLVITGSILVNYCIGTWIASGLPAPRRKLLVAFGIAGNLALLGYFKYTKFLIATADQLFSAGITIPAIVLPIGISFYTFTQIAYLVDQYRTPHRYRFFDYLLFVSFFPHLVAGPILIHKHVIPQFKSPDMGRPTARRFVSALIFFSIGMAKKVLIADMISPYVGQLFTAAPTLSSLEGWGAALLYTLQLYFDFSGYSEMAFGLALMLNVRIPLNFKAPYRATSMIDFWQRWHISLSQFLRNYLYIPLGGNRKGEPRRYLNIFVTMLLGGIWHGAGWTFILWGLLHATAIIINHLWRQFSLRMPKLLGWLLTLLLVVHAWVFFRASNMNEAWNILGAMYGLHGGHGATHDMLPAAAWLIFGWLLILVAPTTRRLALIRRPRWWYALYPALLLIASILNFGKVSEFLYFQF